MYYTYMLVGPTEYKDSSISFPFSFYSIKCKAKYTYVKKSISHSNLRT